MPEKIIKLTPKTWATTLSLELDYFSSLSDKPCSFNEFLNKTNNESNKESLKKLFLSRVKPNTPEAREKVNKGLD